MALNGPERVTDLASRGVPRTWGWLFLVVPAAAIFGVWWDDVDLGGGTSGALVVFPVLLLVGSLRTWGHRLLALLVLGPALVLGSAGSIWWSAGWVLLVLVLLGRWRPDRLNAAERHVPASRSAVVLAIVAVAVALLASWLVDRLQSHTDSDGGGGGGGNGGPGTFDPTAEGDGGSTSALDPLVNDPASNPFWWIVAALMVLALLAGLWWWRRRRAAESLAQRSLRRLEAAARWQGAPRLPTETPADLIDRLHVTHTSGAEPEAESDVDALLGRAAFSSQPVAPAAAARLDTATRAVLRRERRLRNLRRRTRSNSPPPPARPF